MTKKVENVDLDVIRQDNPIKKVLENVVSSVKKEAELFGGKNQKLTANPSGYDVIPLDGYGQLYSEAYAMSKPKTFPQPFRLMRDGHDVPKENSDPEACENRQIPDEALGKTSEQFESGGRGPGTVSTGKGDYGGISYGTYQFESKKGSADTFVRNSPYAQEFAGLKSGTPAFTDKWKQIASREPEKFQQVQHNYIKAQYYDKLASKLQRENGINVNQMGFGMKELVWSTAVQFGGSTSVINNALKGKDLSNMSEADIINAIYDEKMNTDKYFSKCSDSVKESVKRRYAREREMNLKGSCAGGIDPITAATVDDLEAGLSKGADGGYSLGTNGPAPHGFMDPDLIYPSRDRLSEPDFARLARGISGGTLVEIKTSGRVTGVAMSDGNQWDEPPSAYKAVYPDNIVWQTHGGVTMEFDSTTGAERFHLWHPSNSFIEIDVNGKWVQKTNDSRYDLVMQDYMEYTAGSKTSTIDGSYYKTTKLNFVEFVGENRSSLVKSNDKRCVEGNSFDNVGGSLEQDIKQNIIQHVGVNYEQFIESRKMTQVGGNCQLIVMQNYQRDVKSSENVKIGLNRMIKVGNSSFSNVGEIYSMTCGNNLFMKAGARAFYTSASDTIFKAGANLTLQADGVVLIKGSAIHIQNSCDGCTVTAQCWDVNIAGSCRIAAPVIELDGVVSAPVINVGSLNPGSCSLRCNN